MKIAPHLQPAQPRAAAPAGRTGPSQGVDAAVAPVSEPLLQQVRAKDADLFGGATRQPAESKVGEAARALGTDPVSSAGGSHAAHFLKGMGPAVHVVAAGETLTGIVKANYAQSGMSTDYLAHENGIDDPKALQIGRALVLPELYTYTVQKGDTLGRIAQFASLSIEEIATANGIDNPDRINVGQQLRLSGPWGDASIALSDRLWENARPETYTVKPGDTLFRIAAETFPGAVGDAAELQLIVDAYVNWNGIENPNLIRVGQELKVPARYAYTVQPDDTLWTISAGFGERMLDIVKNNGLDGSGELQPGQVLQLHGAIWGC